MNSFVILAIALALAMDAFAVSMGLSSSLGKMTKNQILRLSFHFGFFQFMMPVMGWLAGKSLLKYIQAFDHWVAFGLLSIIGSKMIYDCFTGEKRQKRSAADPTRGLSLVILSVATSVDALAIGIGLAAIHVSIAYPAVIIGLVAFLMTMIGIKIGPLLSLVVGKRTEFLGGLILILIGIKILLEHL